VILVISYPDEDHTMKVVDLLKKAGQEVQILNLSDFPARATLTLSWSPKGEPIYTVEGPDYQVNLSAVRVAWWRRVLPFDIEPGIRDPAKRAFSESETSQAVNGALDALDCTWVNPRCADESAHRKPFQWEIARRVGLSLPRTLVTNDPHAARHFIEEVGIGKTVFKAFLAMMEAWRETRLIEPQDMAHLDSIRYAPVIFQEYIEGIDLRIIIVGNQIFTAEIDARETSYPVDMRMSLGEAIVRPIELPLEVRNLLLSFMRSIGLTYGAIDMRRTAKDEFFFLEVNPAGQWLFVEERTGLPVSQAMADLLAFLHDNQSQRRKT
jgi:glutathione synthase/RimK-type ligase-like ATP-grasp enzyme